LFIGVEMSDPKLSDMEVFFHNNHIVLSREDKQEIERFAKRQRCVPLLSAVPRSNSIPWVWWGYIDKRTLTQVEHPGWKEYAELQGNKENNSKTRSWVYFIQPLRGGTIKIGVAQDPERRLEQIQRMSPVRLILLGAIPGGYEKERELHALFATARKHGEWFEPTPELRRYIEDAKLDRYRD